MSPAFSGLTPPDLDFCLYPLRYRFLARQSLSIPNGKAGNLFRGALGCALQDTVCAADCPGHSGRPISACPAAQDCAYAQLFAPRDFQEGPSDFRDRPRPFVIRAAHLDGSVIAAGQPFSIDVHLFQAGFFTVLEKAFRRLGEIGMGAARSQAEFLDVTRIDQPELPVDGPPLRLSLGPSELPCSRIEVEFRTPTELKHHGHPVERPEFAVLFERVRDRISTLRQLYGSGSLAVDSAGLAERAGRIQLDQCSLRRIAIQRRSSRTGRWHGIGGLVGHAEYSGDLAEFVPWLRAAEWTGVGRHTVWGKGDIRVRTGPA